MMRSTSSSTVATVVVSTVAVITLTTALLQRRRKTARRQQECRLPLSTVDKIMYTRDAAPIATLTWFQGNYTAAFSILEERVSRIIAKNPWLTGRLVKRRGKLFLEYSTKLQALDDYYFLVNPNESPFSRNTPILELGSISKSMLLKTGPNQPLFRVSIVPCHTNATMHFAVIVQLSHVVGDGATFYKIHNMICSKSDAIIQELAIDRIPTTGAQQVEALGHDEYYFAESLGFLINMVGGLIRTRTIGPAPWHQMVLVDSPKIQEAKQRASKQDNVSFVSTNDVVTSWFLQQTSSDIGMMAINFRNRLEGHGEEHAGNYENVILYKREDSKTPGLVRQSLLGMKRVVTTMNKLPGFWEALTNSYAIVSNWSSFAKPNVIVGCTEDLHIPLYDVVSSVPYKMAVCIIFRSGPRGLALYFGGQESLVGGAQVAPFFSTESLDEVPLDVEVKGS